MADRTISRRDPLRSTTPRDVMAPPLGRGSGRGVISDPGPVNPPPVSVPIVPVVVPPAPANGATPTSPTTPTTPTSPTSPTSPAPASGGFFDTLINEGFQVGPIFIPYLLAIGGLVVALWLFDGGSKRR